MLSNLPFFMMPVGPDYKSFHSRAADPYETWRMADLGDLPVQPSNSIITSVMCIFSWSALPLAGKTVFRSRAIITADTNKGSRVASARAFVHSLNILVKYVRLYGLDHKRTEGQFATTWNELQEGLPKGPDGAFLLGVSENKLLMDGTPLETGQAERSFAQLLTTAGLASIHFSNQITKEEFCAVGAGFRPGRIQGPGRGQRDQEYFRGQQDALRSASMKSGLLLPIPLPVRSALRRRLQPRHSARNSSSG